MTNRPSYPLLTLFSVFFWAFTKGFRTNILRPAWRAICCSGVSVALSYLEIFLTQRHWAVFANDPCNTICGRGELSTEAA